MYKEAFDKHRREKVFKEGDMIIVHLQKEIFSIEKLKSKNYDSYKVLKKINNNIYVIGLLDD